MFSSVNLIVSTKGCKIGRLKNNQERGTKRNTTLQKEKEENFGRREGSDPLGPYD